MNFEFATPRIVFGPGSAVGLGNYLKENRLGQPALVVTGRHPGRAEKVLANFTAQGIKTIPFSVVGEPDIATVDRGIVLARSEKCDVVIGLGGGSVMDAAKAIAVMLTNEGELLDYLEVIGRGRALARPGMPFIAVPTTAGTGAEVTRNSVLASPEHQVKVSLRSPYMLAQVAVIDPELTYDLPPALTASTGLDALTQVIEPYVSGRATPFTDRFCEDGIWRVARSLREAVFNGKNQAARADMALASLYGGLALSNAGLGAVHGFAGPIGGSFPAPHGAVCAALLPHVMATNIKALRERDPQHWALKRYYRIAQMLSGNPHATTDVGVEWVQKLVAELPVPKLREFGLREQHVADLVAKAIKASSMKANPIVLTPEELAATLRLAL